MPPPPDVPNVPREMKLTVVNSSEYMYFGLHRDEWQYKGV